MCEYSLRSVRSRPAHFGDILVIGDFLGARARGFFAEEDSELAVCLTYGTELEFERKILIENVPLVAAPRIGILPYDLATFQRLDPIVSRFHPDGLELPNGQLVPLTRLPVGQKARVIQVGLAKEKILGYEHSTIELMPLGARSAA